MALSMLTCTPAPPRRGTSLALILAGALIVGALLAFWMAPDAEARDLMALWLAAGEVASGHPQSIYAPPEPIFTMRPPIEWYAQAEAIGRAGAVYPYVYPPLWAFLLAPLTKVMSFASLTYAAFAFNIAALLALPQIVARLARGAAPPPGQALIWQIAAMIALISMPGLVIAVTQAQPQILVAFLTALALERAQNGRPLTGGIALGLAIAFKLAPLPLALIWLVAGQWRAALAALGLTTALGLLSIAIAGWPLHAAFLSQLQTIGHTIILSQTVASFDQIFGVLAVFPDVKMMSTLPSEFGPSDVAWAVAAKPAAYAHVMQIAMPCIILGFGLTLRRTIEPARRAALWAAAIAAIAFAGPLGWLYYYLVPVAAIPIFLTHAGLQNRLLPLLALVMLALESVTALPSFLGPVGPILGSLGVLVLIGAFLQLAVGRGDENRVALPQSDLRARRS